MEAASTTIKEKENGRERREGRGRERRRIEGRIQRRGGWKGGGGGEKKIKIKKEKKNRSLLPQVSNNKAVSPRAYQVLSSKTQSFNIHRSKPGDGQDWLLLTACRVTLPCGQNLWSTKTRSSICYSLSPSSSLTLMNKINEIHRWNSTFLGDYKWPRIRVIKKKVVLYPRSIVNPAQSIVL